jgi:hypothetical protein
MKKTLLTIGLTLLFGSVAFAAVKAALPTEQERRQSRWEKDQQAIELQIQQHETMLSLLQQNEEDSFCDFARHKIIIGERFQEMKSVRRYKEVCPQIEPQVESKAGASQ